jgi:hypothetical protein
MPARAGSPRYIYACAGWKPALHICLHGLEARVTYMPARAGSPRYIYACTGWKPALHICLRGLEARVTYMPARAGSSRYTSIKRNPRVNKGVADVGYEIKNDK